MFLKREKERKKGKRRGGNSLKKRGGRED